MDCSPPVYPRDSPGKITGVGCHALLQGIFPTGDQICVSYVSCTDTWVLYHQHCLGSPTNGQWSLIITAPCDRSNPINPLYRKTRNQSILQLIECEYLHSQNAVFQNLNNGTLIQFNDKFVLPIHKETSETGKLAPRTCEKKKFYIFFFQKQEFRMKQSQILG